MTQPDRSLFEFSLSYIPAGEVVRTLPSVLFRRDAARVYGRRRARILLGERIAAISEIPGYLGIQMRVRGWFGMEIWLSFQLCIREIENDFCLTVVRARIAGNYSLAKCVNYIAGSSYH